MTHSRLPFSLMATGLAARDLRALLDFSAQLQTLERLADLPDVLLPALLRLIDADLAGWNDIDLRNGSFSGHLYPDQTSASAFAELSALTDEPPLLTHFRLRPQSSAARISDVCDRRTWHNTPAYVEVYRHYGIETQIGLPITTTATRFGGIAMNRGATDFSDAERDVLSEARCLIESAHRRLLRTAARQAALGALGPGTGWLLVTDTGTVADLGSEAADLLAAHRVLIEPGQRLPRLPAELCLHKLDGEFGRGYETTLYGIRPAVAPETLGLTVRQYDALLAVADGSTVAAAARRLDISPQTLATHLRDAYASLGVNGRLAAINLLRTKGLLANVNR
jgi:DNA-binding CsgD family transcriptional regulator